MLFGAAMLAPSISRMASAGSSTPPGVPAPTRALALHNPDVPPAAIIFPALTLRAIPLAQDDDDDGGDATPDKGASPDDIQKYVAVYRAMQRNHSMTVEQATAAQGLTVAAFRDLEQRIESDDLARDDARRALAAPVQSDTPAATPKAQQ
jgi:hypothetical protein